MPIVQSNSLDSQNIASLIDAPELLSILEILQNEAELSPEQAKIVFKTLLMLVHGCASMLANNTMEYNENKIISMLNMAFMGMIGAMKMEDM